MIVFKWTNSKYCVLYTALYSFIQYVWEIIDIPLDIVISIEFATKVVKHLLEMILGKNSFILIERSKLLKYFPEYNVILY